MTDSHRAKPRARKTAGPAARIRVGIGGWTYEPWRGHFYPSDLTQKRELEYASRKLTSIEINGTDFDWLPTASNGFRSLLFCPTFQLLMFLHSLFYTDNIRLNTGS